MPSTSTLALAHSEPEHALRLPPALKDTSLRVRLFAALFRRQLGKVMTPVWVIYARMPRLLWPQLLMLRLAQKGLSLDPTLVDLVQIRVSSANGCTFCTDLHRAVAERSGRDARKLAALDQPALSGALSDAERVALTFADEIAGSGLPSDGTFDALRATFSEQAIVELVWLCSFTAYLNRMARVLGIASDGFCELRARSA
jgi:AhpD family alkylhydroperoxidase